MSPSLEGMVVDGDDAMVLRLSWPGSYSPVPPPSPPQCATWLVDVTVGPSPSLLSNVAPEKEGKRMCWRPFLHPDPYSSRPRVLVFVCGLVDSAPRLVRGVFRRPNTSAKGKCKKEKRRFMLEGGSYSSIPRSIGAVAHVEHTYTQRQRQRPRQMSDKIGLDCAARPRMTRAVNAKTR